VPDADVVAVSIINRVVASGRTDGAGVATLRLPVEAEIRNFAAVKPGVGFDYMENFAGHWPWRDLEIPPPEITLLLNGVRAVQVQALGSDGRPVAGVDVSPSHFLVPGRKWYFSFPPGAPKSAFTKRLTRITDASGIAIFDYFPGSTSALVLLAGDDGDPASGARYCAQRGPSWRAPADAALDDARTLMTVKVSPFQALSGKVLLPDGRPARGIVVWATGTGYGLPWAVRARSRADGSFTLRVASERSYLVGVEDPNWAAASLRGIVVKEGRDRGDLVLRLQEGTTVSGTVSDRLQGVPLGSQMVRVVELGASLDPASLLSFDQEWNPREELSRWIMTDAQGRYTIRLGPGAYRFLPNRVAFHQPPVTRINGEREVHHDLLADPHP
jgi:hypothetical protein